MRGVAGGGGLGVGSRGLGVLARGELGERGLLAVGGRRGVRLRVRGLGGGVGLAVRRLVGLAVGGLVLLAELLGAAVLGLVLLAELLGLAVVGGRTAVPVESGDGGTAGHDLGEQVDQPDGGQRERGDAGEHVLHHAAEAASGEQPDDQRQRAEHGGEQQAGGRAVGDEPGLGRALARPGDEQHGAHEQRGHDRAGQARQVRGGTGGEPAAERAARADQDVADRQDDVHQPGDEHDPGSRLP
ncbi:hypothetical protein ACNF49_51720 [Actinomadura sp. ATCC 39365]